MIQEKDLRQKVEVLIYNNENKFCVAYPLAAPKDFYTTPGGGIDKGETIFDAAKREAMEEVGIEIFRIEDLKISKVFLNQPGFAKAKKEGYKGGRSHYVLAKFKKMNSSILGTAADQREFGWYNVDDAEKLLSTNEFGKARVEAMRVALELLK